MSLNSQSEISGKNDKEGFTLDKAISGLSLAIGTRPDEFTHFLKNIPTIERFTEIEQEKGLDIQGVIFDIDGTLVPPYGDIGDDVIEYLKSYQDVNKKVAVYTNSPHSPRLQKLRDNDIIVIETTHKKPSKLGFLDACKQMGIEPDHVAMIGNFSTTDMPRTDMPINWIQTPGNLWNIPFPKSPHTTENEFSLLPLNILVQSKPADWLDLLQKAQGAKDVVKIIRTYSLHNLALFSGWFVKMRNPDIVEDMELFNKFLLGIIKTAKPLISYETR